MSDDTTTLIERIALLENHIMQLERKIDKLTAAPNATSDQMTLSELRGYIHTNPSESTVRRWMKDGLPHGRVGKRLVFSKTDVDEWLREREDLSRFSMSLPTANIQPWRVTGKK